MKIKIYVNNEAKLVELFEITYETAPDRFKSLRLSNGIYPNHTFLDYKDLEVSIKSDFLHIENEEELRQLHEMYKHVQFDEDKKLINNWLGYKEGTLQSDISFDLQANGRRFRK